MKKLKIGIDIDEVVCMWIKPYLDFHNKTNGTKFVFSDLKDYHYWKILGMTYEEITPLFKKFEHIHDPIINSPLVPFAKETIRGWAKKHEIIFITSRPIYLYPLTKQFLDKHFCNYKLIFSSGHTNKEKPSKAMICMMEKVDLFIDDCLDYITESSSKGIKSILLEKPWNIGRVNHSEDFFLVKNWKEIGKILKTLESETP